jgi:Cu/Ag efflux protein CusF
MLAALLGALPFLAQAQNAPMSASLLEKDKGAVTTANAVELQGVITGIDKATREVTIRGASGNELTITAGPQVKNFKQIKVGDLVTLSYIAALGLDLKKGGGRLRERIESDQAIAAKPGEKPGFAASRTIKVIADVSAVDATAGTITLRGPKRSIDLSVKDKELLKDIRVGDQIAATYEEAVAIAVTPTAPPPASTPTAQ